mmetsp:Transcript_905/g.1194  ORF Transcript_905/g.1194 Transcript_905/m.1194 type:complete len:345 (+) Transcript_905:134-1168(+)|eukprot:CAMPEP_0198151428 /NCGR_PEP_ID=MMETSP1443-20131203/55540_1 /TAXON_ID=186043 /ORGANISM="Entomoneis sp., Strain CCMP2396" /LENGTH=344 /DNA_ID=CAMNT_0043817079 /DNA_START=124 /DNA_END=1158 /DNA_ORIENTATION=+
MSPQDDSVATAARQTEESSSIYNNNEAGGKDSPDTENVDKPTNEQVLNVAFFSFIGFLLVQSVFALMANSQAMLADSEAMSIDAITYLFNMCAERIKNRPPTKSELRLTPVDRSYQRHLRRLYLEMFPPAISVLALVCITFYTLNEACRTLLHSELDGDDDDVSVPIMLFFSAANLLLDVVNVTCFTRADMNFGLTIIRKESRMIGESIRGVDYHLVEAGVTGSHDSEEQARLLSKDPNDSSTLRGTYGSADSGNDGHTEGTLVNLNMCSAWTHVCADTMRSVAVLVAAAIATYVPSVDGSKADAVAAVVVSFIIFISLIPLVQGLVLTGVEIRYLKLNPPKSS